MFLSTGGTNISVPINSGLMALDDSKVFLQAHLGNNMAATTFVSGNSNVVADTRGTGSWKFYVAGGNSIASITGASNSTEWTSGNLLSYDPGSPIILNYSFDTTTQSGNTIKNLATNDYGLTLMNGATIATASPAPYSTENAGYLSMNVSSGQYATSSVPLSFTSPWTISFWHKFTGTYNNDPTIFEIGNTNGFGLRIASGNSWKSINSYKNGTQFDGYYYANNSDSNWNHYALVYQVGSGYTGYYNATTGSNFGGFPVLNVVSDFTYMNFGRSNMSSVTNPTTGTWTIQIDKFQIFNTRLPLSDITALYNGTYIAPINSTLKDAASGVAWKPVPGSVVDATETNYTVKSNEIALRPGANSTFAVWTATKSTNLKIDVSFADYHTRSAGVGFQMFKIKSDNTFDSVLFPRTVTSTALTNAATTNYLPVPTVSTTVTAGDKIYLRVDANGNTTAASSVLATTIFTDAVSIATNPVENRLLQANLASNLNATTFVSGNSNVVLDTAGNSNWQFYVAPSTSVAAITSSSNSTEWTNGTVLSANDAFAGTLLFGATYVADAGSRVPGKNYLKLVNSTINPAQCASISPFTPTTNGISFSFWIRHTTIVNNNTVFFFNFRDANTVNETNMGNFWFGHPTFLGVYNNTGSVVSTGIPFSSVADGNWHHIAWTMTYSASTTSTWKFYLDGVVSTPLINRSYMNLVTRTYHNIGNYGNQGDLAFAVNGGVDNFRVHQKVLSDAEVLADIADNSNLPTQLSDSMSQSPVWKLKPAIAVNSSETLYTVKSNEIAIAPGANSTYAVWTSPKTTNIKVDVSFADYHTRSAGVGFQMFKINADNTFGSVIYPRTVTSTALTNANPNNYLSVPSRSVSVTTGDKIYLRIDANGNPTSASSVLSTNIYVDPNQDLKQPILLQAHLGNNMAATTFVSGNSNVVADTRGTGSWKFYAANSNSIASITGLSNSTEWTSGSLLTYTAADYSVFYPFNTNTVSGSTVLNMATNAYDLTLYGGASIINTTPFPATQPPSTGSGYLNMNLVVTPAQYAQPTQPYSFNPLGSTISFWVRWTSNVDAAPVFSYGTGTNFFVVTFGNFGAITWSIRNGASQGSGFIAYQGGGFPFNYAHITLATGTGAVYINGVLGAYGNYTFPTYGASIQPTWFYFGNYDPAISNIAGITRDFSTKTGTIGIDNFVVYNKTLTATEVMSLYAKSDLHYPFDVADINPGNPLQVGDVSTGPYVYNGTLVNGATIAVDSGSRIAGQGYLKLVSASGHTMNTGPFNVTTSGLSFSFWFRATSSTNFGRIIFSSEPYIFISVYFADLYMGINGLDDVSVGEAYLDNVWRHSVFTIQYGGVGGASSVYKTYVNGVLRSTFTQPYPALGIRTSSTMGDSMDGGIDDFRIYHRVITDAEISYLYNGPPQVTLKDDATGVAWMPIPATPVDASETSYTIKNNEVALKPGTNSTFAVWTATKFTNLKIDVSFADYHTRSSAGVGFQMFKIKSDNTFDSVLFPRTVTSTALTNASPNNYLPVPSVSTSVSAGDKIYLRVDANGNTTAASSVLATTIFTDAISIANNPVENRLLQAHLGNNLNATTFVSGNANVVLDTLGTSNWQFYVAPSTSVAAITSSSNSTEWMGGTVLSANDTFPGTLLFGATYVADAGSRVPGKNYLKLPNSTGNAKCASISPFTPTTNGISFSFWIRHTTFRNTVFFFNFRDANTVNETCMGNFWFGYPNDLSVVNNTGSVVSTGIPFTSVADGNWHHIAWTMTYSASTTSTWKFYLDGVVSTPLTNRSYMNLVTRIYHNIGNYGDQGDISFAIDGGVDNFRVHQKVLSDAEVLADIADNSNLPTQLSDSMSQSPVWKLKPAIAVNSSETLYTVKSNEIAIAPGANSTYAVWTAPKSTNIKVDVSFADYHSRNVGVGFQMFKINNDNTFGSVIYPRTVTSVALTNAAPTNYLSVPSRTISVATGDKIYYRVDANGNPTSASSVLATTIYVDPNQDLKQYNVLQANLGNNMAATTFVSGNSNVVSDTRGTGNWQFYVAGGNSIASITGASNSAEWTGGNLLSYIPPPTQPAPTNYNVYYPINVADINPSNPLQVGEYSTGSYLYNGTLANGATISTDSGARVAGQGYLKITNISQSLRFSSFTTGSSGISFSLWVRMTIDFAYLKFFDVGREGSVTLVQLQGSGLMAVINGTNVLGIYTGSPITDGVWKHYVFVMTPASSGTWKTYLNGEINTTLTNVGYPTARTRTQNYIFNYDQGAGNSVIDVGVDDFQFFNRELSASEVYNIYASGQPPKLTNATTGTTWVTSPTIPVDSSETSYTIKNNEIALTPGTNSTYAVWTATKSTNLKIDVSFADYHSRSAGVGFQMFKIKSDNTFDSVLFPRTVTSTALTNAAPTNYLPVPSVTTTVIPGDKIYIRVDANGNTTAASSVLATNIYTDAVSIATNPAETRVLQANLAANLNSTTFVSGNANTVLDTVGNGDWKFYVANGNSIASISSASNSTEWTGGSLLSYSDADYSVFYPFNTNTVSGSTVLNAATNAYDLTLYDGASIINTTPFPATQPPATGSGYLNMNVGAGHYAKATQTYSFNPLGSTFSFWVRWTNIDAAPVFSYGTGSNFVAVTVSNSGAITCSIRNGASQGEHRLAFQNGGFPFNYAHIAFATGTGAVYINGVLGAYGNYTLPTYGASIQPTWFYFGNIDPSIGNTSGITRDFSTKTGILGIDNFVVYNKTLTATEVMSLYAKSDLYYPLKIPDINSGNTLQVGDVSTGPYVYNGALVNGATIVADTGSRIAGQGYLKLVKASGNYFNFNPTSVTTAGFTIAIWFRATSNNVTNSRIFDMWTNGANISIGIKSSPDGIELQYTTNLNLYTGTVRDNVWRHFILTIAYAGASGASSIFKCYIDGTLQTTYTSAYPALGTRNSNNLGTYVNSGGAGAAESFDGGLDDFRIYQRVITDSEISYLYAGSPPPSIKDSTTGAAWISKPAIAVDPAESSYTVKSNEIALRPGTNSTFAVWTAPKSTNIRVDVSFADYHSRSSAGVGFQMFKINNDNTFGSTIFPRTVTSTALTNAAPTNYLNVPSVSLSVTAGDKLYYRVDANGNTTSASSVISTNIYSYSGKWN